MHTTIPEIQPLIDAPIITPDMLPADDGSNINGPTLICAIEHFDNPLGRYYLYFAHHQGKYIRLAYADELQGPWHIHESGVIPYASINAIRPNTHVASPDICFINGTMHMYVHGPLLEKHWIDSRYNRTKLHTENKQGTICLTSEDGITFQTNHKVVGPPYFRLFNHENHWYALGWAAQCFAMTNAPDMPFEIGGLTYPFSEKECQTAMTNRIPFPRHTAMDQTPDGRIHVYYSKFFESPERLYRATLDTSGTWNSWTLIDEILIRKPTASWEGADLPAQDGEVGATHGPVNALRDPYAYRENNKLYLLWSVAGEYGIAIGEVINNPSSSENTP